MSVSQATPVVAGTLAVYNDGAALTKVTNKATLSFSGAKTVATAGYLGGLVGLANVGSVYTDCHNTGDSSSRGQPGRSSSAASSQAPRTKRKDRS